MSNSQLNKLKHDIKNGTEVTFSLSTNLIGDSNDENNFPYKLLLTNVQVPKTLKTFANVSSANTKFSKTQLSEIVLLGIFLFSTGTTGNPLMLLAKNFISLMDSIEKESKNMDIRNKKNSDIPVDAGLSLFG